ncbi:MAG TPA: DUF397 domain-containing protein [Streptosporangiaceae bacterium]
MWRKSRRSGTGQQSDCVEIAALTGAVGIRDSKHPQGANLSVSGAQFAALVRQVKRGDLDL